MCQYILPFAKTKIAEQDIEVYKLMFRFPTPYYSQWMTMYRHFQMEVGKRYASPLLRSGLKQTGGYHAFKLNERGLKSAEKELADNIRIHHHMIGYGDMEVAILKGIIPKDSKYIHGFMCASQIPFHYHPTIASDHFILTDEIIKSSAT